MCNKVLWQNLSNFKEFGTKFQSQEKRTLDFEKVPKILYSIVYDRSRNGLREKNSSIRVTVAMQCQLVTDG